MRQVRREIDAMNAVNHPNVLRLFSVDWNAKFPDKRNKDHLNDVLLVVLELAEGGELFDFLSYTGAFSERIARTYFTQLVSGIKACHDIGIAHRDLKPENLLMDANFMLKIADFGFAHAKKQEEAKHIMLTECGTRGYMAPEILSGQGYGPEADIFAAGVVLFITLAGFPPFQFASPQDWWFDKLLKGKTDLFWKAHERQASFSESSKDLIERMLAPEPSARIGLVDIFNHSWIGGATLNAEELKSELQAKKDDVQSKKRKEREALAKKNARARVRGARDENRSVEHVEASGDGLPSAHPSMNVSGLFAPKSQGIENDVFGVVAPSSPHEPQVYDEKTGIECYTQFISGDDPRVLMTRIMDLLDSARCKYSANRRLFEARANFVSENGSLDFIVKIYQMHGGKRLVQFRKVKGNVLQFHELYDELLCEIADLVYIPEEVQ